jgi:hypothetical protein
MSRDPRTFRILMAFAGVCLLDVITVTSTVVCIIKGWLVLAMIYAVASYLLSRWVYKFLEPEN